MKISQSHHEIWNNNESRIIDNYEIWNNNASRIIGDYLYHELLGIRILIKSRMIMLLKLKRR